MVLLLKVSKSSIWLRYNFWNILYNNFENNLYFLFKVPEVKDTVHKHSLLHHLCHMVMESGTETTDLYSEIGPITRASKADFADLAHNLSQLEHECKASWDRLKLIAKHDCPPQLKQKLVDFLADCAERIIILQIVHRRVMNRWVLRKFYEVICLTNYFPFQIPQIPFVVGCTPTQCSRFSAQ